MADRRDRGGSEPRDPVAEPFVSDYGKVTVAVCAEIPGPGVEAGAQMSLQLLSNWRMARRQGEILEGSDS